ncbi:UrvD/REP family ATP-dependent DNA helicase [Leucobacter massiliensis]|uniref:DNA 3'-5' helicase n=1 Tax=Leucobacter massiliensis TaxID=1686285 RepID=A0A2S9QMQ9_9MICO|nr:UrvD/REP family ATP-dependent DNA helicase [Leucobacter massiliensis]PRI10868.1 hypothetical protein B4915_08230 [Leucobacter massiliensis]
MISFDPAQLEVLALDPGRHARVLGAPGTGKTVLVVEAYARAIARAGWAEGDALVLAPNRLVASALRRRVERAAGRAIGGTPVRTTTSLAFAVLSRAAAVAGREAPRLLTGTAQDEAIAETVEELLLGPAGGAAEAAAAGGAGGDAAGGGGAPASRGPRTGSGSGSGDGSPRAAAAALAVLPPEVLRSPAFRAELRELWRVVDDFGLDPGVLASELRRIRGEAAAAAHTRAPEEGLIDRWCAGLLLIELVATRLASERPGELSSSALLRAAAAAVRERGVAGSAGEAGQGRFAMPRLLLVDDAQELGEGDLALLAACASSGSRIWVFGDPDMATGAFRGERTEVLTRLAEELARRGAPRAADEQSVVLRSVHRHGSGLRGFVRQLTDRIGAAGAGGQRSAEAAGGEDRPPGSVEFTALGSPAEQIGVIAHRLRARRLGLDHGRRVDWNEMAVICRSRAEALRVSRALAAHQVPTGIASGGTVLREHQIVRELIRLLQHALGIAPLSGQEVLALAGGTIGGLDPVQLRRLRGALLLQERREAQTEERPPGDIGEIALDAFEHPGAAPVIDSAGGRALRRLGRCAAAAERVRAAGGTARETLWALWEGTRLAGRWQDEALDGRGARADEAHRSLDAVMGLFFALQRHEEQASSQPIAELLDELLLSAVPEDTLAQRSERAAVTVTTPQGAIGREFGIVAVIGVQDGAWPNLRARGSLLGTAALERWLRGGAASPPSRKDTVHDELRLFAHSCARAREEVLVAAVSDEDQYPSAFFGLGREQLREGLPSSRLTLRGAVAQMRRRLTTDAGDEAALTALTALARAEVPGARPEEWYGVPPASSEIPLFTADPDPRVPVSPSQLERAETCPLDWAIAHLGGGRGSLQAGLGTLLHHALDTVGRADPEALLAAVTAEWSKLPFDAEWESVRAERLARAMTESLAAYLRAFEASGRELIASEAPFEIPLARAVLRGMADRLELTRRSDGAAELAVLDLKTGRTPPSKAAAEEHAQLQAYQMGVSSAAFALPEGTELPPGTVSGGARLLYVHPDATGSSDYAERVQQPISEQALESLRERVDGIAEVMASAGFTARVEHHCSDPHQPGECRLHIIPAVSRA